MAKADMQKALKKLKSKPAKSKKKIYNISEKLKGAK